MFKFQINLWLFCMQYLNIKFACLYRYSPGGSHVKVMILARVDEERSKDSIATCSARLLAEWQEKLPIFHTRQMKRQFKRQ